MFVTLLSWLLGGLLFLTESPSGCLLHGFVARLGARLPLNFLFLPLSNFLLLSADECHYLTLAAFHGTFINFLLRVKQNSRWQNQQDKMSCVCCIFVKRFILFYLHGKKLAQKCVWPKRTKVRSPCLTVESTQVHWHCSWERNKRRVNKKDKTHLQQQW